MNIRDLLLVVFVAGCGTAAEDKADDGGVPEGVYRVEAGVLEDTCGGADGIVAEWRLRKDGGEWLMTDAVAGKSVTGTADGDTLSFVATINGVIDECDVTEVDTTTIEPYKAGFSGTFRADMTYHCSGATCHVVWDVLGIPE